MAASTLSATARLFACLPSLMHVLVLATILFVLATAHDSDKPVLRRAEEALLSPSNLTLTTAALAATPSDPSFTSVIQIFYIDERAYEGLPYTAFHRDSGAVIGVDAQATTFVITTTRTDMRPSPTHSRTDNVTTGIPTLGSRPTGGGPSGNFSGGWGGVGEPSTITQGPATFMFTGTRFGFGGPDHTVIDQCRLNGTVGAACNLTHIGAVWYTGNPDWNGTYSTYSYNWTSGDRFGFAPVTITLGVDLMAPPTGMASASANGAVGGWKSRGERGGRGDGRRGLGSGFGWLKVGMGTVLPAAVLAAAVLL